MMLPKTSAGKYHHHHTVESAVSVSFSWSGRVGLLYSGGQVRPIGIYVVASHRVVDKRRGLGDVVPTII